MVMESVKPEVRGRASAASTLAYGIGDQLGIFAISLVVGVLGMRITKLLFIGIPLVLAVVLIRQFTTHKNRIVTEDKEDISDVICPLFYSLRILVFIFLYFRKGYIANAHSI